MLLTSPDIEEYVSGVILFDETIRQKTRDGTSFVELLERRGIVPGIKVDKGVVPLAGSPEERITDGLDGLRDRLRDYLVLWERVSRSGAAQFESVRTSPRRIASSPMLIYWLVSPHCLRSLT